MPDAPGISELLAIVFGLALLIVIAGRWTRRRRRSRLARRRGARAVQGEDDAIDLLESRGYRVLETQAARRWQLDTDDGVVEVELRADLLVEQDGRTLVAEVKTGEAAPSLGNAATRRQLLEYRVAYPVDGVLLVDVEGERIIEVEFPGGTAR